ncbi:NosD domain-containing protein [Methanolobus bombayensis]|uniref:NosD domain-containing protein n=1 Tax=Methanolobus bombayensis TaxID=38023 RepID=UPI001AE29E8C|nr:NosD domain-containing protein [Methanolobus bombayensis]MBP1910718.1 PGF-pre-PGF domain-containing protein [Methanolobus bombayensis]
MLVSFIGTVSAQEIMVGSGYGNTTITAALANASNGDIITVTDGTYSGNIEITTDNITIRSENGYANTIFNSGSTEQHAINISADNVTITGLKVSGSSDVFSQPAGIYLNSVSGCNISNNYLTGNSYGVYLSSSTNNTVRDNIASSNSDRGIFLESGSSYNNIINNTANSNLRGISLKNSNENNNISYNTVTGNQHYGIHLHWSDSNTLTNNTASDNDYYGIYLYYSDSNTLSNNTASDNDNYGLYLEDSDRNNLTNNTAINNIDHGIYLDSSLDNTLTNNTASNNDDYGIYLYSNSDSNTLTNNTASDNVDYGIYLSYSTNNTLTGNVMSQNAYNLYVNSGGLDDYLNDIDTSNLVDDKPVYYLTSSSDDVVPSNAGVVYAINCSNVSVQDINIVNEYYGVVFYQTDNSTIENATISECYDGISLISNSYSNTLTNNTASNNDQRGIYLSSSDSCTLTNNTASNDTYGIYLYSSSSNTLANNTASNDTYGIYLASSSSNNLTNNTASNNDDYGIYLASSDSCTLTNNTANDTNNGICLSSSNSNNLTNNIASNNDDYGIYLYSNSDSNTLTNNTAINNSQSGILLSGSDSNTLTNNTAINNSQSGIFLYTSGSNNLTDNQVDNNTVFDLRLISSTNNAINPLILGNDMAELTFTSTTSTVEILRNETNTNNFSGKTNINGYIEINSVLSSMNMSLFYNNIEMSSAEEATIALYKLNGTEWAEVQSTTLDTSSNTLSVSLTEFGTFALFRDTNPTIPTTPTTTSSSSSGTRASVSQGQNPTIVSTSSSSVKRITGGSEINYDFSDSGTPVLGVSFDAKNDEGLVVAKVQVLSSAPEGVLSASGNSYQMMSIDVGSEGTISSDSADNVMLHFKVSKQWIEENNIDVSTIRMTRYHGDQWNDLPTTQESEDGEYFYFYAETPGFSIFEVVGDEISETSEQASESTSIVEEEAEPVEEEETSSTPGFTALAGIVFVSFAFLVKRK